MDRSTTLPLLIALALAVPLTALAQTDAAATAGVALPQAAASAASTADQADGGGSDDGAFQQTDNAERRRIADGRAAAHARYDQDRRACWQRFAVNACLDQARERRRAVLDALRHDELALNAQERERRTAARLDELAHKQAASAERHGKAAAPAAPASGAQ